MENSQWDHENAVHSFTDLSETQVRDIMIGTQPSTKPPKTPRTTTTKKSAQKTTPTKPEPVPTKPEPVPTKPGPSQGSNSEFTLRSVVELLILKGLCSIVLWETSIENLKVKVSNLMNRELLTLYINLKAVTNAISVGVIENSDLSQEKLELINESERSFEELMLYVETVLPAVNDPPYYSQKVVKTLIDLLTETEIEKTKKEEEIKKCNVVTVNIDDSDDDIDDKQNNALMQLFGSAQNKRKGRDVLINQTFVLRSEDVVRRLTTPGEKGRFMVKIEVTDCNDLKGVSKDSHWTKVWKKVVFLTDEKSDTYNKISEIILTEAENISKVKEVQTGEYETSDDKGASAKKRARFSKN